MSADEPVPIRWSKEGPDGQIRPGEAAKHIAFIALELQLALLIAVSYRCGPFQGVLMLLLALAVAPIVMVPIEALLLGIPALVALLVLRERERTGKRKIWWRVQLAGVGILLAAFAFATAAMLSGHAGDWCDLS